MRRRAEDREEADVWEESRMVTGILVGWARAMNAFPLERIRDACNLADSAGAIFDPTGYRTHGRSVRAAKRVVEAAIRFKNEVFDAVSEDR